MIANAQRHFQYMTVGSGAAKAPRYVYCKDTGPVSNNDLILGASTDFIFVQTWKAHFTNKVTICDGKEDELADAQAAAQSQQQQSMQAPTSPASTTGSESEKKKAIAAYSDDRPVKVPEVPVKGSKEAPPKPKVCRLPENECLLPAWSTQCLWRFHAEVFSKPARLRTLHSSMRLLVQWLETRPLHTPRPNFLGLHLHRQLRERIRLDLAPRAVTMFLIHSPPNIHLTKPRFHFSPTIGQPAMLGGSEETYSGTDCSHLTSKRCPSVPTATPPPRSLSLFTHSPFLTLLILTPPSSNACSSSPVSKTGNEKQVIPDCCIKMYRETNPHSFKLATAVRLELASDESQIIQPWGLS